MKKDDLLSRWTQKDLEASERRYRRLFESAKDGILILNADTGRIIDVNPFLTDLTGYSREDFLGKHLWEIGTFKDIASSMDAFARLKNEEYVRYEDLPLETRDGRKIDVEFVSNVYRDDDHTVIQCNIRDITTRVRTQKRDRLILDVLASLNREGTAQSSIREVLRLIRKNTDLEAVGIRLRDGQDFPYYVTTGFSEAFAIAERTLCAHGPNGEILWDVNGKPILECMCGNVLCGRTDPALPFFSAGGSFFSNSTSDLLASTAEKDRQARTRNRCNSEGYESLALVPLRAGSKILGLLQLNDRRPNQFDLETIRFFEEMGAAVGIALARKKAEDVHADLEAQLRGAQKMEAIGGLAGGIAHDFNNLLSVILNYTDFVLDGLPENDLLRRDLEQVKKAGERAAALTRQLLAFSRKQVLQPVSLSLNQIAEGVEKMLGRILGEDIELVQRLAPDLGMTSADPGQIEQVLMNLVVNARDAMPGGGKLTIETSNIDIDAEYAARHVAVTPGPYVMLAVTDTGCGMDAETKGRIFEPFFTTKEKDKGTGLGLSTVYGIVKQSGGNIWVYSEPGLGTTFKIYLQQDLPNISRQLAKPSTVPATSTGTETILVVEDEEALRKVAVRILENAGYQVMNAGNGDEALLNAAGCDREIQLLLTDVVMPRMGGRTLAEALWEVRPQLKVLYMSGYTDDAILHHGVLDAGTHFLGKPFTAAALTRKVREVLDE